MSGVFLNLKLHSAQFKFKIERTATSVEIAASYWGFSSPKRYKQAVSYRRIALTNGRGATISLPLAVGIEP